MNLRVLFPLFCVCLSGNLLGKTPKQTPKQTVVRLCNSTDQVLDFFVDHSIFDIPRPLTSFHPPFQESRSTVKPHDREHLYIGIDCLVGYGVDVKTESPDVSVALQSINLRSKFCDKKKDAVGNDIMHVKVSPDKKGAFVLEHGAGDCNPS